MASPHAEVNQYTAKMFRPLAQLFARDLADANTHLAFNKHAYYMPMMTHNLGFLISDVSRLMRRRFDERTRIMGVTRAQWRTLTVLNRNEGINQGKLAELLEVEPISLCRMVDRLEEAGHVERRRDPGDRRAWRIFLTDRARPLIDQLGFIADDLFKQALGGIDPAEQARLMATLNHLRTNLAEHDETHEAHHG